MSTGLIDVRVRQMRLEAEGIVSFEFVPVGSAALPTFGAGAHTDLHLPGGKIRSYSLVNLPSDGDRYVVAVQREEHGSGGSNWMHTTLRVGHRLRLAAATNDFPLVEGADESVFIAGGIGITPILPMLRRLEAIGRPWRLHYAGQSPERSAFVPELRALDGGTGRVGLCFASSRTERLDIDAIVRSAPLAAHLYCCGPSRMIQTFTDACAGRDPTHVHFERFAAASEAATQGGFEVVLARSGQRYAVQSGMSILNTLLDHGVEVAYACSSGVCGTCRTGVLEGEPDHRDDFLTADERLAGDTVMICCSGSLSRTLVLDL